MVNASTVAITHLGMREADNPEKGEVELRLEPLQGETLATINGRLFQEDTAITKWLLYVELEDGRSFNLATPFNPWDGGVLTITATGDTLDVRQITV